MYSGGRPSEVVSLADAARGIRIAEAIIASAAGEGRPVRLEK